MSTCRPHLVDKPAIARKHKRGAGHNLLYLVGVHQRVETRRQGLRRPQVDCVVHVIDHAPGQRKEKCIESPNGGGGEGLLQNDNVMGTHGKELAETRGRFIEVVPEGTVASAGPEKRCQSSFERGAQTVHSTPCSWR